MANIITCIRIVCGIMLMFCAPFSSGFYLIYLIGGLSDVLDGFVARHLHCESALGAKLDTIADILFSLAVIIKVLNVVCVPIWLIIWITCIAIIKCASIVSGIIISKQFITEHTVLNKMCGILLFAIPFCIGKFPWQAVASLVVLTCVVATAAAIQEYYYMRIGKTIK